MIKGIEINNLGSINECKISFEKSKYKFLNEYQLNETVANPIAIYGRNGSGKTSFIEAFKWITYFLSGEVEDLVTLIPNFLNDTNKTSSIKLYFELNKNNYEYMIRTNIYRIVEEYLIKDDKKILDRQDDKYYALDKEYEIKSNLFPALRDYAFKDNESKIADAYNYLSNIAYIGADKHRFLIKSFNNQIAADMMVNSSNEVKDILKKYGSFPIYDIMSRINEKTRKKEYYASIEKENDSFMLPLSLISNGMHNQSFMLTAALSLPENGVLVVDELEDALHPLTIMNFIDFIVEKNIQLIFVSNNTNTLSRLRPDNIIFANWKNGYSTYKRLCDIYPNIREVNNIEKMYLSQIFDEEIEK